MKKLLGVAVLCFFAGMFPQSMTSADSLKDRETAEAAAVLPGYDPARIYAGVYEANRLYVKRPNSAMWVGHTKPALLRNVTCPDAENRLSTNGMWYGHLKKDGSCGSTAEPLAWATGNYLNFEALPDTETP